MSARRLSWRVLASSALVSLPAVAQICPGDTPDNFSLTSNMSSPNELKTWAITRLLHGAAHPSCSGVIGVQAQLYLGTLSLGCNVSATNASPIATATSLHHERVVERRCAVYLCSSEYQTRGRHYFNGALFETTIENTAEAGCGPQCNPCSGPGYSPDSACPSIDRDACGCCPELSPIVIDRSGDGLQFSSVDEGALFEFTAGRAVWMGWPTTTDDAWLALDRDGNGMIVNGRELFGNTRELQNGRQAQNGYEVLAELDVNGDKVVDAQDPDFARLLLWGDANRNGVGEPSELALLSASGIRALAVDFEVRKLRDEHGNHFRLRAVDGSSVDVYPAWRRLDSAEDRKP